MSVRNLRIREDTAKYLRNLDVNSAHYDPKTRSMRANPTPNIPVEEVNQRYHTIVVYSLLAVCALVRNITNQCVNFSLFAHPYETL